ncbi:MAG TPA: aminotransferase class V-fold PLP-dependent enzyme, partial [Albitalea sp.]|nr:aminotransferase class V-fold PLP-dependent enzyme [Albitalea sp.]
MREARIESVHDDARRGLRAHFPVLDQRMNGAALAYLDNAATTQTPLPVLAAMNAFEQHERANIHRGVHTLSQRATEAF